MVKKTGLLNQPLSAVIAGLPIPPGVERIDLAVSAGLPPFLDVLHAILGEMQTRSPQMHAALLGLLSDVPVQTMTHEQFKVRTREARAVVRTGGYTPYANVILIAGVMF